MIFGATRAVYYLEAPTATLADLDGSREQGIRNSVERFLSSPDSAFEKTVAPHVHQVRDLGTNLRTFATWCQDEDADRELCVVQAIYRKANESRYFALTDQYDEEGANWKQRFRTLDDADYEAWLDAQADNDDVILVTT